jgi:RNA processing factor Prp31
LIYHASLIGKASQKHKGKISRSLAAKTALAIRCDALGDGEDNSIGVESRLKVSAAHKQFCFYYTNNRLSSYKRLNSLRHGFKFSRTKNLGNLPVPQRGSPR